MINLTMLYVVLVPSGFVYSLFPQSDTNGTFCPDLYFVVVSLFLFNKKLSVKHLFSFTKKNLS